MKCNIPVNDLGQKLDSTVCRYKGQPVFVRVLDRGVITLYELPQAKKAIGNISANDPDFDIASVPLGYMQAEKQVYYLTRSPQRRVKQGVESRTLRYDLLAPGSNNSFKYSMNAGQIIVSKGFADMILGNYPDLMVSLKALRKDWANDPKENSARAVNRNIAMYINEVGVINVYYKQDFVGWIQPDKFVVHVPSNDWGWVVSRYLSHELSWKID